MVRLLPELGPDILARKKKHGRSLLGWATVYSNAKIVTMLLDSGVNINARESIDDRTPLYLAAWYGHQHIVHLLLERESIHSITWDSVSFIDESRMNTHESVVVHCPRQMLAGEDYSSQCF